MGSAERVREHRERLRASGLRPVQIWLPDTRTDVFKEECARQCKLVAALHEDKELDVFMDAATQDIEGWE